MLRMNVNFSYSKELFQLERELELAKLTMVAQESAHHECNCAGHCDYMNALSEAKINVDYLSLRVDHLSLLEFQDLMRIAAENEEKEREALEREEKEKAEREEKERMEYKEMKRMVEERERERLEKEEEER